MYHPEELIYKWIKKILSMAQVDFPISRIEKILSDNRNYSYWGLPLGGNWSWLSDKISYKTIPAGKTVKLWERSGEMGFAKSAHMVMNNPNLVIRIKLDTQQWETSVGASFTLGYRDKGSIGINVIGYDAVSGIYTLEYQPGFPGDPYKNYSKIEVYNPTSSDIIVIYSELNRIVLDKGNI